MKTKSIKELFENYQYPALTSLDHILCQVQQAVVDHYADHSCSLTDLARKIGVQRTTLMERRRSRRMPLVLPEVFKAK